MPNNPTPPNGLTQFNGTVDSWVNLFNTEPIAAPGNVFVFFAGRQALERLLATWHLVVTFGSGESGRIFKSVYHVVPAVLGSRDVYGNILKALKLPENRLSDDEYKAISGALRIHNLATFESPEVIHTLSQQSPDSAIAISFAELLRVPGIEDQGAITNVDWTGVGYRSRRFEDIYFPHLLELIRLVNSVAKSKHLFVTLFCEVPRPLDVKIPDDIENDENIFMIGVEPSKNDEAIVKFAALLRKAQDGDDTTLDECISEIANIVSEKEQQALLTSQLYFAKGLFGAAWTSIAPHLSAFESQDSGLLLGLSKTALSAGITDMATKLLQSAMTKGLDSFETLHLAYLIATELRDDEVQGLLLQQLVQRYPNEDRTIGIQYNNCLKARRFGEAREHAVRMKYGFGVAVCETFAADHIDFSTFLARAHEIGELERGYTVAAREAEMRGKLSVAHTLASKVGSETQFASEAMRLRIRVFAQKYLLDAVLSDARVDELTNIMRHVAEHPNDLELRFQFEDLLKESIEEPLVIAICSYLLRKRIQEAFDRGSGIQNQPKPEDPSQDDLDAGCDLFRDFVSGVSSRGVVVGRGSMPLNLRGRATPSQIRGILFMMQNPQVAHLAPNQQDYESVGRIVHFVALCCNELNDPSSDMLAARIAIGALARSGNSQRARDFAETVLLAFPGNQPSHVRWRTAQAWACYADAFHRTGNRKNALIYLCLSFLSGNAPYENIDLLCSDLRLATRIFRDLGLSEPALETIEMERRIRIATGSNPAWLRQLSVMELSIALSRLSASDKPEKLLELLSRATELVRESDPEEIATPLSCQAHLIRELRSRGIEIPPAVEQVFQENLAHVGGTIRATLGAVTATAPTSHDLIEAINRVAGANNLEDLSCQIYPLFGLARNTIKAACKSADVESFLMASAILSQPVLALRATGEASSLESEKPNLRRWALELYADTKRSDASLADAAKMVKEFGEPMQHSITAIRDVSLKTFRSIIANTETAAVLAWERDEALYRVQVSPVSVSGPEPLTDNIWSGTAFLEWQKKYPRAYGAWDSPDPLRPQNLPEEEVRLSTSRLSLGEIELKRRLLVIPDATLFGFPFALSPVGGSYLGEITELAVVPSVPWLTFARSSIWKGNSQRKAWLGSPGSNDLTIHFLRDRLTPILSARNCEIVADETPASLAHSSLCCVVSHGRTGVHDHFASVSDATKAFTPSMIAQFLEGSGCVILFMCNAGRSDLRTGTSETVGLATELLATGVRCVIASAWPLHAYVPPIWLGAFLECLSNGGDIGAATHAAAMEVRKVYSHPSAWGALQLFGDPAFLPSK